MLFSPIKHVDYPKITINDVTVSNVNSAKFLGCCIDDKLKGDVHIQYVCKHISWSIAMLRAGFKMFSKLIKLMIYHAYISSHLYYCTEVWGNVCNIHLNHLLILQNFALRLIVKTQKLNHTAPIAHSLAL